MALKGVCCLEMGGGRVRKQKEKKEKDLLFISLPPKP